MGAELADQLGAHAGEREDWINAALGALDVQQRAVVADATIAALDGEALLALAGSLDGQYALQALSDVAGPEGKAVLANFAAQLDFCPAVDFAGLHADAQPAANNSASEKQALLLDLTQIGLAITGIFDPTPISDGIDGVISVFRGDWLGAGISAISMVPYLGDLAKAGKLERFAQTLGRAVDIAGTDAHFADQLRPILESARDALNAAPLDSLPQLVREPLLAMKGKVDEFFDASQAGHAAARAADTVGGNTIEWTLDAAGRPTAVEATLTEVFPSAARSSAERAAQADAAARGIADDVGGHVIGHRFVLDQGSRNLIPQNGQFNNGAYRKMENEWAAWIDSGREVHVQIDLLPSGTARPDQLSVTYDVLDPASGDVVYSRDVLFNNQAGESFERVPTADMNPF